MGFVDKLLKRESEFNCLIQIHELQQVPLVEATFKVKWKFKVNTTSHGVELEGLLGGLTDQPPLYSIPSLDDQQFLHPLGSPQFDDSAFRRSRDIPDSTSPTLLSPSVEGRTPNPERTPTSKQYASFSSLASPVPTLSGNSRGNSPYEAYFRTKSTDGSSPLISRQTTLLRRNLSQHLDTITPDEPEPVLPPPLPRSEPKGCTPLASLHSYTAAFHRKIYCRVSIPLKPSLSSTKFELQPAPVRLAVRQEMIDAKTGKKEEIKTGEVMLDLSQFVGSSRNPVGVTRRYLLKDSKTNATLRVTVQMEWVGGETHYIAPPLRSGQISLSPTASAQASLRHSSSSTSLGFRNRALSNGNRPPSSVMTRTSSSSSISASYTQSSDSPREKRGWHPTAHACAPASSIFGASAIGTERSATDIIDSLFNHPNQPFDRNHHQHSYHSPVSAGADYSSELIDKVEQLGLGSTSRRPNGSTTPASTPITPSFSIPSSSSSSSPTSKKLAPPVILSQNLFSSATTPRSHVPPRIDIKGPSPRKYSGASDTSSRSTRIRWGDDEGSPPQSRSQSSLSASLSTASTRSAASRTYSGTTGEEAYERGVSVDTIRKTSGKRGGGGERERIIFTTSPPPSAHKPLFGLRKSTSSSGSGTSEIEWGKSW